MSRRKRTRRETQRFFSVKGSTYAKIKAYAIDRGMSVASCIESWVHNHLDEAGVPEVDEDEVGPRPGTPGRGAKAHSGIKEF